MKTKKQLIIGMIAFLSISLFTNCNKESDLPVVIEQPNKGGVFILNQGNFGSGNGSLSYFHPDSTTIINNVFETINGNALGDTPQSVIAVDSVAYVTVNASGEIVMFSLHSFKSLGTIEGLSSPRYLLNINDDKIYVSDISSSEISVIDIKTNTVYKTIDIGRTSEHLVISGKYAFAANYSSFYQQKENNMVMVIDTETDRLIDSVQLTKEPNSMVLDKNNDLWVLSSGGYLGDVFPALTRINTSTFEIEETIQFDDKSQSPNNLCLNATKDSLFFLNSDIYKMAISENNIPSEAFISNSQANFYALGIYTMDNNHKGEIYVSDALDYIQNGVILRYSSNGDLIKTYYADIIPGFFYFNN